MWDRLADFASRATRNAFGVPVTYRPQGGAAVPIVAPFKAAGDVIELQAGVPVSATRPILTVRLADLPAPPRQEDRFTLADGRTFEVSGVEPDGEGNADLIALEVRP